LTWMKEDMSTRATTIRYERIRATPPSTGTSGKRH
jgi:hypothetical protein